ncbi:lamin tail domain-containing protein [Streptomyces sp. NPDC017529]|uniref:lamin tail domain-containing protein n=1 Tax=Streptomyces sp. NPDC017529 TaxID=3365000 RepID=UPI0037B7D550
MIRFAPRLATAVLGSAALAATMALPASATAQHTPAKHRSPIVIGAVQADSPGRDTRANRSLNGEWITVQNTGRHPVNLKGWTLSNSRHQTYRFNHLRLGGHKTVRVHTGRGHDNLQHVFQNRRDHMWDNKRDTATLRDQHRHPIDTERWGRR